MRTVSSNPIASKEVKLTIVADGEGSAREHAALQPRFFGCALIVARSFARIHETNLKVSFTSAVLCRFTTNAFLQKQGILPVWFEDKADYAKISAQDTVETKGVEDLLTGNVDAKISLKVTKPSGETFNVPVRHTMSADQIDWLRAGSALNYIASMRPTSIEA